MPYNFRDRLAELSNAEKGWLDGTNGEPVSPKALTRANYLLEVLETNRIPQPTLFPMEEGGIHCQWGWKGVWMEVEVYPETYILFSGGLIKESFYKEDVTDLDEVLDFIEEWTNKYVF